jgi:YVTN family beta-propeller protein
MYWDADYNRIWAGNANYIGNLTTYTIFGFAADSLHLQFKTATGFTPYKSCLHRATNKLFSVSHDDEYIAILDMAHPTSCTLIAVGHGPYDVIENTINNKIYCANRLADSITILDALTNSIIAQIPSGQSPAGLAFNQTDNKVYCTNRVGNDVTIVDGVTNQVLDTIPVGTRPESILWNSIDNKIYVGNSDNGTITIIDASSDTVITTIPSGMQQVKLYHDAVNDKIYSANFTSGNITVINGVTNQVVATITAGGPYNFAKNPAANKIYCGCVTGGMVHVIDCETDSIINSIFIGSSPTALIYNQQTNKLFCGYCDTPPYPYPWQDALAIIDCSTDSVITRLILDTNRWSHGRDDRKDALIFDSLTNTVYYTHYTSSKISVLDGAIGIREQTITAPHSATFRVFPNPALNVTNIVLSLPGLLNVRMTIHDVMGRIVRSFNLPDKKYHQFIWDGTDKQGDELPSGVYFMIINADGYKDRKKFILLR